MSVELNKRAGREGEKFHLSQDICAADGHYLSSMSSFSLSFLEITLPISDRKGNASAKIINRFELELEMFLIYALLYFFVSFFFSATPV
jgi:hypothetical protein